MPHLPMLRFRLARACALLATLLLACSPASTEAPDGSSTVSTNPALATLAPEVQPDHTEVVDAIRAHRVVAMGEWHGSAREHAFIMALLEDPQVAPLIDSVVIEFGSAVHQDLVDQYVAGASIPDQELAQAWTTTTQQSGVWNAPIYRAFYRFVRDLNAGRDRKLRLVLGDPGSGTALCSDVPSDCVDRNNFMAEAVTAEVDQGRRTLLFAGVFHVVRSTGGEARTAVDRLEAQGEEAYVIVPIGGPLLDSVEVHQRVAGLPGPTVLPDAWSSTLSATALRGDTTVLCDHPPCDSPGSTGSLADLADAYIYLGPLS